MNIKTFLLLLVLPFFIISGCSLNEDYYYDDEMPDFDTEFKGTNPVTGLSLKLDAYREHDDIKGDGELIIDGYKFDIDILDAFLSTDGHYEYPIPTDDNFLFYEFTCTPRFSELIVKLDPGNHITTIKLNECELENEYEFDEGFFVYNPCNGYEVIDYDHFNGVCIEDNDIGVYFGDDTVEIEEFGEFCGPGVEKCIIPEDVFVDVYYSDYDLGYYENSNQK